MALYIDSAYLPEITNAFATVPVVGVTTNPSIMLAAWEQGQRLDPAQLVQRLLAIIGEQGTLFIQSGVVEEEEMYQEALASIQVAPDRIIPKIPMTHTGMRVARRLKRKGRRIAFTSVTTVAQAYGAAMIDAEYIIPYFNRLERSGINAQERLAGMAAMLHHQRVATRILAASIKSAQEAERAILAGAHDITAAPKVLLEMLQDPQSEEAVAKFAQDWAKMKK